VPQDPSLFLADAGGEADPAPFSEESIFYYRKAVAACLSRGVQPILVVLPREGWQYGSHLAIKAFADECGIRYVDFNFNGLFQEIGMDVETDFYDPNHLNISGSAKVSKYLGSLLAEEYGVPDRRGDESLAYREKRNTDAENYYGNHFKQS